jgi:hypothetical protein
MDGKEGRKEGWMDGWMDMHYYYFHSGDVAHKWRASQNGFSLGGIKFWENCQVGCGFFFFFFWFFLSFWGEEEVGREAARRGQNEPAPTSVPCSLDEKLSSFFSHSGSLKWQLSQK